MKIRKCSTPLCCLVLGLLVMTMACVSSKERIETLHRQALVWDCHNDLSYRVLYEKLDISQRLPGGHVDIPRLKEGGVDVQTVALFIQNFLFPDRCASQARQLLAAMLKAIEQNSDQAELARTGSDIERIVAAGRIAMPLAIEGGHAIENSLENLREFHRLGVSSMTLTHNVTHDWADSGADEPRWGGLNQLGRDVVREMNRLGMVIDISHVSDETFFDVIEISEDPVIASHSGCRTLNPHSRNMSNEMLRALAENGGVIGIVFVLPFLTPEYLEAMNELEAVGSPWFQQVPPIEDLELRIAMEHLNAGLNWPLENLPTIEDVLNHIDHAVKIAGVDHVGLGADMYPRTPSPVGIRGVQDYPHITRGLKKRGYSDKDIRKIMGGNFLRVWKQVTESGAPSSD
ncbi:MAG: dipeptidase [Candidatus Aminicenantes bacterium]|nr:dipeptidase [Candidatus Aminicenantes bacterium]